MLPYTPPNHTFPLITLCDLPLLVSRIEKCALSVQCLPFQKREHSINAFMRTSTFAQAHAHYSASAQLITPPFSHKYWSGQNRTNWTGCASPALSFPEDNGLQHCSWPCWHPLIFACYCDRVCRVLFTTIDDQLTANNRIEENPVCCCVALLYTRNNEHDHLVLSVAVA